MYKIGELSKLCNLSVKTLRYYESLGLLCPDMIDSFTGYRYYSATKLSDCYRILSLKELGFSLEEIKEQMNMPKEELLQLISAKQTELEKLRMQTEQRIKCLYQISKSVEEEQIMFNVVVRGGSTIRTAYVRKILDDRKLADNIVNELKSNLPERSIGNKHIIIDYETEYEGASFDMGICVEICERLPEDCKYEEKVIDFQEETASLICKEEQYDDAVIALRRFVGENNLQITGPTYKLVYEDGTVELKIPICRLLTEKQFPKNDNIDLLFEDDERVIGHWELVDYLPSREQFHPDKPKSIINHQRIKELYFLPGGEKYWCFGWTKGYLLSEFGYPKQRGANPYTIERVGKENYLFVEMKFHDYFLLGGKPEIWVFRQLDNKEYSKADIAITDEIEIVQLLEEAGADDTRVLGKWAVCDLLKSPDDFVLNVPNSRFSKEALFWISVEFFENGKVRNTFRNGDVSENPVWRWVTGNVICVPRKTASMYKIRQFGDEQFIFIQWKSGDYSYGGEEPYWYVFKKE